eukprot:TRINITY_DN14846_c0_g1_i1.p1 TRINITY_DN14846_c0_g1~~TRINITY_DN14846_c0_g1_i1.p1  ORF type:complete len:1595 (+),score=450.58 TRINITY_DN14846_c0_g1_i1:136-4785(+)
MAGGKEPSSTSSTNKRESLYRTVYLMDGDRNKHQEDLPPSFHEAADAGAPPRRGWCGRASGTFADNELKSAKYTFVNPFSPHFFIWKNLWEQFHRMANVYFLFMCAIMQVPGVSPIGRFTFLAVFLGVLTASMVKAVVEDMRRHADDREKRARPTQVLRGDVWETVTWADVATGDVVRVAIGQGEDGKDRAAAEEDEGVAFPCDLILVATPDPQGLVYIATMDLDGETNLKPKEVIDWSDCSFAQEHLARVADEDEAQAAIRRHCLDANSAEEVLSGGSVYCKGPSKSLSSFDGLLRPRTGGEIFCQFGSFLPRGAKLRQVSECVGVAVYTGLDTRLGRNMSISRAKQSTMEHLTNIRLCFIVLLQLVMCLISSIGFVVWMKDHGSGQGWYLDRSSYDPGEGAKSFLTFFVLYGNLIPISMYVSMEMTKLVQGYFLSNDLAMYDASKDLRCTVKSTDITEELGQVEHVFSDKTGTLTQNIMQFLKYSVDGVLYGQGLTSIGLAAKAAVDVTGDGGEGSSPHHPSSALDTRPDYVKNSPHWPFFDPLIQERGNDLVDEAPVRRPLWGPPKGSSESQPGLPGYGFRQYREQRRFWEVMALCHTVLPKRGGGLRAEGKPGTHVGVLEGESPDEKAFVAAAGELGMAVTRGDTLQTTLAVDKHLVPDAELALSEVDGPHVYERWERLLTLPFDSTRKCMSVIVREPPRPGVEKRAIHLMTKGADSAIEPRLSCLPSTDRRGPGLPQAVEEYLGGSAQGDEELCERYSFMREKLYSIWRKARGVEFAVAPVNEYQEEVVVQIARGLEELSAMRAADGSKLAEKWPESLRRLRQEAGSDWSAAIAGDVIQMYQTHWLLHEASPAEPDRGGGRSTAHVSQELAEEALRVMWVARRRLSQTFWDQWSATYVAVNKITNDQERTRQLKRLSEDMEASLELCGLSAIEDKLQDRVPEVIQALRDAGVRVWMITGDKPNTAENIALACRLFDSTLEGEMIRLEASADKLEVGIAKGSRRTGGVTVTRTRDDGEIGPASVLEVAHKAALAKIEADTEYAVLVTSAALTLIWEDGPEERRMGFRARFRSALRDDPTGGATDEDEPPVQMLYEILNSAKAVVVARATPDQKKQMVRLIKERNPWAVTLAIGDGANDVSMIQAASIGVGIQGEEGGQAAAQADFAIGQFKFLHRLLFVHGRWNYRRLAVFCNYFFYKNAVLSLTLFFYNFFNGFSGQSLFDRSVLMGFNVFWASWPVIIYAMFDRDVVNTDNITDFPLLYKHSLLNGDYTGLRTLQWYLNAFFHAAVCLFLPLITSFLGDYLGESGDGRDYGMYHLGVLVYTNLVTVITLKLGIHVNTWTWVVHFFFWGCYGTWPAFLPLYGDTGFAEVTQELYYMRNSFWDAVTWSNFWLILFLCVVVCLVRDAVWQYATYNVVPLYGPKEVESRMQSWKRFSRSDDCKRLVTMREHDSSGSGVSLHKILQMLDARTGKRCYCCRAASYLPPWELVPGVRPPYGEHSDHPQFNQLLDEKGYGRYCSKGEWLCCCSDRCGLSQLDHGPLGCGMA